MNPRCRTRSRFNGNRPGLACGRFLRSAVWSFIVLCPALFAGPVRAAPIPDFTFLHCSDVHTPTSGSAETIAGMRTLGKIELAPYHVTADAPSFVIVTGDLTEFGGGSYANARPYWDQYLDNWKNFPWPVYHITGNHDNTWHCMRPAIRALHGRPYYSFDKFGCHFVAWDSASVQDPRPSYGQEEILWLQEDLEKVGPERPVFFYCHHPLDSLSEMASRYEMDRLLDILRPHNVALVLVGHGHTARTHDFDGIDGVQGGSTFSKNPQGPERQRPGYNIVSVKGGVLRVAYKPATEAMATLPLLEKPLAPRAAYPKITIESPAERQVLTAGPVTVRARIEGPAAAGATATAVLDDAGERVGGPAAKAGLEMRDGAYRGTIALDGAIPGAHVLRVDFTAGGKTYHRSAAFYLDAGTPRVRWRAFLRGSCRGTPAISADTVYAGGQDGLLVALDRRTGAVRWTYDTGGEIAGQPLLVGDTIYVGSGDGRLHAVSAAGERRWAFKTGAGVYSSPVHADGSVLFGSNDTEFYAVDARTGTLRWSQKAPGYAVECRAFVSDGTVYFGAWDSFLYAMGVRDGAVKWTCVGAGSRGVAARYYSPADGGPVVAGGRVFAADRKYVLSMVDAASGDLLGTVDDCTAVSLAAGGRAVYLRRLKGDLAKADLVGAVLWSRAADLGAMPAPPVETSGLVLVASATGLVSALDADTGDVRWRYRATPFLFVMSGLAADGDLAVAGGLDGSVTALEAASR